MSRDLFGTDGVRGLAGEYPLDSEGARRIGAAVATHFCKPGDSVIIGSDTRQSSPQIVSDLVNGLNSVGVNVVDAGVIPTPGLAYLTREGEFAAGIMVTASHNPYEYNGIKVFSAEGGKLSDEIEATLNKLIEEGVPVKESGNDSKNLDLINNYEDFLIASGKDLQLNGIKIAIDQANGAASGLAERVFRRLGAEVTSLSNSPDGRNINDHCGATDTANLCATVKDNDLDLGIALDGDADRIIMCDERGREVKGDYLMYILAVAGQAEGVVATTMSNLGFELALKKRDIRLLRADVGDRYVLEDLAQSGYPIGGEQSGHIIIPALLQTGDALLAAVQVLKAVKESGKSLAEWCDEVELLPQALVNIPLDDKAKLDLPEVQEFLQTKQASFAGKGRLLIRPSGTEPLARVMVEADDAENLARQIADELKELLAKEW